MKAADFTLTDQNGRDVTLSDHEDEWIALYFYPKDDTPGCTKEACSFRDGRAELASLGITVLGVSKDSVASHKRFADKYDLPFTLLSDPDATVIRQYDAWGRKKFMGREFEGTLRKTYLIGPGLEIRKVYENVTPAGHAQQIMDDVASLQETAAAA